MERQMQRFPLGRLVATPSALHQLERLGVNPLELLGRHLSLDPGALESSDRRANERAADEGLRILSVYWYGDMRFYVLTEADRSFTTILLPREY